jgi:hypothetical protein
MATEAELRAAIATAEHVLAGSPPYPRELFPELRRGERRGAAASTFATATTSQPVRARRPVNAQHTRPVTPAAQAELTPEAVAGWSAELGFATGPRSGRITRAND